MTKREFLGFLTPLWALKNRLFLHENQLRVLMYHDIPEDQLGLFENQIKYLIRKKYHFVTVEECKKIMTKQVKTSRLNLLVTFDDGFASNDAASKILDKYGIKGVFFIPPDFVDCVDRKAQVDFIRDRLLLPESSITEAMKPLTWEQLSEMKRNGHCIGAHTLSHARVSRLSLSEAEKEILNSKKKLEEKLHQDVTVFAFPFGDLISVDKKAMKIAGDNFELVFSAIRGRNTPAVSRKALRREGVLAWYYTGYVRFILEGGLDIKYRQKCKTLDGFLE